MANFFQSFMSNLRIFPVVKAQEEEEELVDQQDALRTKCREENGHAKHLWEKYQGCNDRVNSKTQTSETCVEELVDYLHALDHCVSATLFKKLK
ncbi:cytochrome b-c1 complex subunit 6, mitochondrial [Culicoides brevitarsis]|uniref:cytochrome b-c1 complex subunit 6, mitochondrial n=1 Tax=Culicoides brevitarsis TaxID=469753 RepID=UPI00307B329A